MEYHVPVLLKEVVEGLNIRPNQWYVDATVGGGGHAAAILQAGGNVLGIDQDQEALDATEQRLSSLDYRLAYIPDNNHKLKIKDQYLFKLVKGNFRDLSSIVAEAGVGNVAGVLMDLGVSSHQLDTPERGFGFRSATLDMRMDASLPVKAADLVDKLPERDLAQLIFDLGEERYSRRIAAAIVQARGRAPIVSGQQLSEIIWQASPVNYRNGPIHPATRTFQALRLAVNDELGSLREALPQAWQVLQPGGRLAIISFHSLEDRVVKQFMHSLGDAETVTKKPLVASEQELKDNPRSRSAKLRIAEKRKPD